MLRRMLAILILAGALAVCVLGAAFGSDSRHVDTGHTRRNI
jgi:hypothetical protein